MSLDLLDPELNLVRLIASVKSEGWEDFGKIVQLPEEGRDERAARWASGEKLRIINVPDTDADIRTVFRRLGKSLDISMMFMHLELEGKRVGLLALMTEGTGRYTEEHGELVLLLNEPFAVAMVNALKHQEVLRLKDMLADDNRYFQRELRELSGAEIVGAEERILTEYFDSHRFDFFIDLPDALRVLLDGLPPLISERTQHNIKCHECLLSLDLSMCLLRPPSSIER